MQADRRPVDLGEGVWHFEAERWRTSSILAVSREGALVCDPNLSPREISGIRDEAVRQGCAVTHLLLTHSHFDHCCGIGLFPEAIVVAGAATAEVISNGDASAQLEAAGNEWGYPWPSELRVDRIVASGSVFHCDAFRVAAIDAPGNTMDGTAYVLLDQGVMLSGDFLSSVGYPFLEGAPSVARATCERLLSAIDEFGPRWVVTGHGPALAPGEARSVGEADLAYLQRLEQAAQEAVGADLSPAEALLHTFAVEPPRPILLDFELYTPRVGNARRAIAAESPETDETGWRLFRG